MRQPGRAEVFLHRYAINPVNGERIPVWASDYVLADYGTRYQSKLFNPRFLHEKGLPVPHWLEA